MKAKPSRHAGEVVLELNRGDETLMERASGGREPSPFRLKNILVPIDFSDCAKKALEYAIPFAREHDATVTAIYVVPPVYGVGEYGGMDFTGLEAESRAEAEARLNRLVDEDLDGKVSVETIVRNGPAASEIIEAARDLPADLIIISTHGRTGLKHALLGSVAEHVVRAAPCPVLVVREKEHEFIAG